MFLKILTYIIVRRYYNQKSRLTAYWLYIFNNYIEIEHKNKKMQVFASILNMTDVKRTIFSRSDNVSFQTIGFKRITI